MSIEALRFSGCESAPPLKAKLAPWMESLLEHPEQARNYLNALGSPLHVTVASEFRRNVRDLLSPLSERGVSGGLFFARKANKLPWFVISARDAEIGVDTASLQELSETLQLGVSPERITVTAIGKEPELVSLAVSSGALIVIDNDDELQMVKAVARSCEKVARVGLRFSGFEVHGRKVFSRFGLPIADAARLISEVLADDMLELDLLHAHLDRYDIEERAQAGCQLLELVDYAARQGGKISSIDLGGGILMRYLEKESDFNTFTERLYSSVLGTALPITFMNDGLGYVKVGDSVIGKPELYPAWNNLSKERFIAAILDASPKGVPLHKEISNRQLGLYFEPGRALLDNTGVTLARVSFRKRDTLGNLLIGVTMNRMNLRPFRAEFCSDPILLTYGKRETLDEGAFLVGNLCSESDFLFRRKIAFKQMPQPGDVVCFINTAGYLAHHMEIGTHGNALPVNVLIDPANWRICASLPE